MTEYSRTVEPWDEVVTEVATGTRMNQGAWGYLGGARVETTDSGISDHDIDGLTFSFTTEGGRAIKLCGLIHVQSASTANTGYEIQIKKGSTILQRIRGRFDEAAEEQFVSWSVPVFTFAAGEHTIVHHGLIDGVDTFSAVASASLALHVWAEDAGPVPETV